MELPWVTAGYRESSRPAGCFQALLERECRAFLRSEDAMVDLVVLTALSGFSFPVITTPPNLHAQAL